MVAGDGVDEEHLANVQREGEPATQEESDGKIFCILSWRVKHSPDAVDTIDHTEVQIQTKLDPTTLWRIPFSPLSVAWNLTKYPDEALHNWEPNYFRIIMSDAEDGYGRRDHKD